MLLNCSTEMKTKHTTTRLEYLRGELRAERISYGELAELQSLASHIEPGDVELLEAAGVPESSIRISSISLNSNKRIE